MNKKQREAIKTYLHSPSECACYELLALSRMTGEQIEAELTETELKQYRKCFESD